MIIIFLKYINNMPIVFEVKKYSKFYWYNFQTAKQLDNHRTDMHLQTHLIIVFSLCGFYLLHDLPIRQGG